MLPALAAQDDGGEGEEQRRGHKQQQPEHGEDGEHLEPVQYSTVQYSIVSTIHALHCHWIATDFICFVNRRKIYEQV